MITNKPKNQRGVDIYHTTRMLAQPNGDLTATQVNGLVRMVKLLLWAREGGGLTLSSSAISTDENNLVNARALLCFMALG